MTVMLDAASVRSVTLPGIAGYRNATANRRWGV